jgi:hypothetical protein
MRETIGGTKKPRIMPMIDIVINNSKSVQPLAGKQVEEVREPLAMVGFICNLKIIRLVG